MALDLYIFYFYFRDLNLKLFQVMNMSEFYSDFYIAIKPRQHL